MKNLYILTIVLVSAGLAINGCKRSENPASGDQKLLQGNWSGPATGLGEVIMAVSGDKFDLKEINSEFWYKGTFTLNEEVAPKQIDFLIKDCSIEEYKGTIARAIYKIETGVFKFACYDPGDTVRPTGFDETDDSVTFTLTKKADG
jgi:uncharacterized protein (TIGR03067 family)